MLVVECIGVAGLQTVSRALKHILLLVFIILGALLLSLGIKIGKTLPPHAVLLGNSHSGQYVTVPCVIRGATDKSYVANVDAVIADTEEVLYEPFVVPISRQDALVAGMKPDRSCANADGFLQMEPWLFDLLGLTKERVAKDGTVLW